MNRYIFCIIHNYFDASRLKVRTQAHAARKTVFQIISLFSFFLFETFFCLLLDHWMSAKTSSIQLCLERRIKHSVLSQRRKPNQMMDKRFYQAKGVNSICTVCSRLFACIMCTSQLSNDYLSFSPVSLILCVFSTLSFSLLFFLKYIQCTLPYSSLNNKHNHLKIK